MKAEIITIGDEILIGQVIDTNSAWISEQLNLAGVEVSQITSVHDNKEHILEALQTASTKNDLVLITGGLGPTKDDITKKVLCDFFQTELVFDQNVYNNMEARLSSRGVIINQLNEDQALVPKNCAVLPNTIGTAPGMWFEKDQTIFISMPGVPFEMEIIMTDHVLPKLRSMQSAFIIHKTVLTQGLPESTMAETIEQWENELPSHIKLAYLPNAPVLRLRLSAYGNDKEKLENEIKEQITRLNCIIPEYIFGYDNENIAMIIGKMLTDKGKTMVTAESCTGGNIAHIVTSNPGSSAYFKGSIVAYSNEVKHKLLGVDPEIIEKKGAVSREVAESMAAGALKSLQADYAVSTTGIAGPDGGTEEKPVGTVWIAVASKNKVISQKFNFAHNRERNIIRSTFTALNMLRLLLKKEN